MQLLDIESLVSLTSTHLEQDNSKTEILISIGAVIAASNEKVLKECINKAKPLNIPFEEITKAINIGDDCRVKRSNKVIQTTNTLLNEMQPAKSSCSPDSGCC